MDITLQEFLNYLSTYNQRIFPMQYIAYVLGLIVLILIAWPIKQSNQVISGILAFLYLWVALIFGLPFALKGELVGIMTTIVFLIQGFIFTWFVIRPAFNYGYHSLIFSINGFAFIVYAMVGYPLFGIVLSHRYPESMAFGLTPCPLSIFTFGTLMLTQRRIPIWIWVLPVLYSISGVFPIRMGILEDIGLVISGIIFATMLIIRDHLKRTGNINAVSNKA